MMSNVYIVGVGMTPLGRHLDKSVKQLSRLAIDNVLADAGCEKGVIEAAWFANTRQGIFEGQHGIRGQCALRAYGFEEIAIFNTDNACCSSSSALLQAFAAVKAGLYGVALVVGAEKMNYPEKSEEMFSAFKGSWDRELADEHIRGLCALGEGMDLPPEAQQAQGEHSVFMDIYSASARFHMKHFGTTQRQIAEVASKNHWNSQFNPLAQYQTPMTVEEVLADKLISWPVTRSMCAPMSDGAGAVVICNEEMLSHFNQSRAVRIMSIVLGSGTNRRPEEFERQASRLAAQKAYRMAGIGPRDISVAELHDASASAEIIQSECMGFCELGMGGKLVESGSTRLGGALPINPSGGLLSKGHPTAATGAIQIHELVTQLRGEAGKRQVEHARFALAENGGGFYGLEEAAVTVTILGKD